MRKFIENQSGVTLIETIATAAIIVVIMVIVLGGLLYGQKMVVFSDTKNNAAAQAQDLVDEIMTELSGETLPSNIAIVDATQMNTDSGFVDPKTTADQKQYIIVTSSDQKVIDKNRDISDPLRTKEYVTYNISVRVYYNNNKSYVDLKAYAKKGGVGI